MRFASTMMEQRIIVCGEFVSDRKKTSHSSPMKE